MKRLQGHREESRLVPVSQVEWLIAVISELWEANAGELQVEFSLGNSGT